MIRISQTVIVEGKYDKIRLESLLDAVILETDGFRIFRDRERLALFRRLARKNGVLILTDSDEAGFRIRRFLGGALPPGQVRHAYIPDLYGREKRKAKPSKEGKLGVEGMPTAALLDALRRAGVLGEPAPAPLRRITKADLFEDGLSGRPDSRARRLRLLKALRLPERLSANAMLAVLNAVTDYDSYRELAARLRAEEPAGPDSPQPSSV